MIKFSRQWCMPNSNTFSMNPVKEVLAEYVKLGMVIIDPFARDSKVATLTNDLNPNTSALYHMEATDFLDKLISEKVEADVVLFDPPYGPRQITECYQGIGKKATQQDTQSGVLYKKCKDKMTSLLKKDGIAISFGWSSVGFGINRGFEIVEIVLLCHGGAHNDTIIVVEKKI